VVREVGITLRSVGLSDEQVAEAAALYANGKALAWFGASRRLAYNLAHQFKPPAGAPTALWNSDTPAGKCVLARKPFVVRRFHLLGRQSDARHASGNDTCPGDHMFAPANAGTTKRRSMDR
jgi:hypothetical protein